MAPPTPADNHTVVAAEADANGNINLLSWNQATNSFNLQLFGANGTHRLSSLASNQGAQATYDAESCSTSISTTIPSKDAISNNSTNQPSTLKTARLSKAPIPQTSYKTPTPNNSSLLLPPTPTNVLNSQAPMAPPTHRPITTLSSLQKPMPAATSTSS